MSESTPDPWLEFTFDGPDGAAIDARAAGQLLLDLTAAARQIAADLLRLSEPKGPMSADERALAAFTLKTIGPGSIARVELAPPTTQFARAISFGEEVTDLPSADHVLHQLEKDLVGQWDDAIHYRPKRRNSMRILKRSLGRIGPYCSMGGTYSGSFKRIPVHQTKSRDDAAVENTERRVYYGKAMMADADPDRRRVRAALYDGRRYLLDVADEFATPLADILERDVEFRVVDTLDAGVVVRSTLNAVRPLEAAEIGIDFPAKDWRRLAIEQSIDLSDPPDYAQLLRRMFDSDTEVESFKQHIVSSRGGYEFDE